ncbi:TonB-dependent receptor domain-containing protein [Stutzerimonas nitrititolerans]|uniref:TonB-dependent receptor domain-containing protein n=1 Tax=Stutzerimonas nitrititolerans TaxID=2482751 RepID=UPI00289BFD82|nr:TonB-dependent receptor [Stutzerimonas nitrititolerans]
MPFTPKKLALLISSLYVFSPLALVQAADAVEQAESGEEEVAGDYQLELPSTTVIGRQDKDAEGHDKVYQENVTSIYKGREELQRFEVTNPGDVFKGMNGVYSMDTRSSQAITPNIRGITGEGRTPLTIDGTEQSTNVWLHFVGAGNRSYVDPALFRSIEVEKGPSLSRGIKSGVGGAVNIRTIEASDIIPEGDSWGIETNLKTSGNTRKPRFDASSVYGQDYRSLPGAERANLDGINIDTPPARTRSDSQTLNFEDHSEMLAIAGRNEFVDILLSRSERTSGNYYAGKHNADRYSGHPHFAEDTTDRYIPNLTKVYAAGSEVFNTSSETETTLIKNNWYLPNEQKLGLQFMRTDTTFGETTPGRSMLMYAYREGAEQAQPDLDWANMRNFVYEDPRSELRLDSYKLSYDIKPKDSSWLNLETSLWQTKAKGTRYQTGISPWGLDLTDDERSQLSLWESTRTDAITWLGADWWAENAWMFPEPDHDGTIIPLGRQWTTHDRTGFDFSNQMILTSNLQLTLGGSYQQEKLDERVQQTNRNITSMLPDGVWLNTSTDRLGPRSGERKEYSAMMNLTWQATDWLTVTAGTRYLHYTGKDTGTAKRRRQQSEFYKASRRLAGLQLRYEELMTPEDAVTLANLQAAFNNANAAVDRNDPANFKRWDFIYHATGGDQPGSINHFATENKAVRVAARNLFDFLSSRNANRFSSDLENTVLNADGTINTDPFEKGLFVLFSSGVGGVSNGKYWLKSVLLPNKDGKFDSSVNPFATGEADATELVDDPYNPGTTVAKYRTHGNYGTTVYEQLDTGNAWEMPEDQSGDAFSPVLSATARITPFGTAFVRYAQTTRFPSINELTSSAILDGAGTVGTLASGASKPERSTNWEVGYAHDLTQFFPSLGFADVRISYYKTEIDDFIDRGLYYDSIQFDKKKSSGVELQSRFDTGRVFGSLGATYRLNQKLCDKDYASSLDPYYNRIPTCMTGGFPGTYSGNSLQPKYSIDLLLGTRLFNERLELGWRSVYHAGAENSQLDDLLASEAGSSVTSVLARDAWFRNGNQDGFYWRSVLLHDLYANFEVNKQVALNLGITNLTDEYYLDPMAKTLLPGPGRTLTAGLKVNF